MTVLAKAGSKLPNQGRPKTLTLTVASAVFTETLDDHQHSARCISESRSHTSPKFVLPFCGGNIRTYGQSDRHDHAYECSRGAKTHNERRRLKPQLIS
jgi:hypothetical protein